MKWIVAKSGDSAMLSSVRTMDFDAYRIIPNSISIFSDKMACECME